MIPERDNDLMPSIFIPLIFMNEEQRDDMVKKGTLHIFEYYDKAGPRSINGYPIFFLF